MENLLMQYRNDIGCTYRKLARKINNILYRNGSNISISHESAEDYAKSQKQPRYEEVSEAIAELIGCTTKEFLASLRTCRKAGKND